MFVLWKKLPLQDFDVEVRPAVDVEQFFNQGHVFLLEDDVAEETYPSSVDLVDMLLNKIGLSTTVVEEAKKILFTHDAGM